MVWAVLVVVGQVVVVALLLYFIRTFGQYTDVLRTVHEENLIIRQHLILALNEVKFLHEQRAAARDTKEVA